MKRLFSSCIVFLLVLRGTIGDAANAQVVAPSAGAAPVRFVATTPGRPPAGIVVSYGSADVDWEKSAELTARAASPDPVLVAVHFLREAMKAMSGQSLTVSSGRDLARGIVLVTLANAPGALKKDPEVIRALRDSGEDSYNANEAFFVRSEAQRVVVVANNPSGLLNGVVELLGSVGYEVLGFGPNWTYIPDFHDKPLAFAVRRAGRPGFYIRSLHFTSGQVGTVGTLEGRTFADPADENVTVSHQRWMAGTRKLTRSMPDFPGHALQAYHQDVVAAMRSKKSTEGFLAKETGLGPDAARPVAIPANAGQIWINTDEAGQPGAGKVFFSGGDQWHQRDAEIPASLDLSVPLVREAILDHLKRDAEASFKLAPDSLFVFGTDPEDGSGYGEYAKLVKHPNWYPEYLAEAKIPFGKPYVLNRFKGLVQPTEKWDSASPSDSVFGFNNWLLQQYDKWIDSLPAKERVTSTGKPKKQAVRASLLSYNYHDVPPHFNLDSRIRVMIAGYPKHRGQGEWKNLATQIDIGHAFKLLLPREPSGDYWILSLAYHYDNSIGTLSGSASAAEVHQRMDECYKAGFKSLAIESDLNFGKKGLAYYLYSKMLWDPHLTAAQLDRIRTRWLQRAFGAGWVEMKAYYDFMTAENYTLNTPHNWAKAIRLIESADPKIADDSPEQKRLDDLKQFWYFYYLLESGQSTPASREFREFVWKGQMSYMTAMFMVTGRFFGTDSAFDAAGSEFNTGPPHYTHEETQRWWARVLDFWKLVSVEDFRQATLADGSSAKAVDLYDLVLVKEFRNPAGVPPDPDGPFRYNSSDSRPASFLTVANAPGEEIGFKMMWPWDEKDMLYRAREVHYGISRWNPARKAWEELVDMATTSKMSASTGPLAWTNGRENQLVTVRYKVPRAGTYRVNVGPGGFLALLASLNYDALANKYTGLGGHTYDWNMDGLTQNPVYIYIPKGTKSLDLEVWGSNRELWLYSGLPLTGMKKTRVIDVSKKGTQTIALNPGEDGSFALLWSDNFYFPHLYSVPQLWAKSPAVLYVPRAIAKADGLTIINK